MALVIAGGPSVDDYPREDILSLCKLSFVIGTNAALFDFPCDLIVALDPIMMDPELVYEVKRQKKPILCRNYPGNKATGLDLIEVPLDIITKYPFSGMAAAKLSDALSAQAGEKGGKSYILGMDANNGSYKGYRTPETNAPHDCDISLYEQMGLTHTINLSVHSKIPYWPKLSKLPHFSKVIVPTEYKIIALAWLRAHAKEILA